MKTKDVILAIDDNPLNLDILVDLLNSYDVLVALNAEDGLALLNKNKVDLILLDIMMPQMNGFEMAKSIKSNVNLKDIPILFLSAINDDASIEKGFGLGAVDYVVKPFRPKELKARVHTHLTIRRMYKEVEYLAYYDYLSGVRNRRSFFELATPMLQRSKYLNIYAIMIDIDKFKNINDTYGHAVGDVVIKSLAQSIKEELDNDVLFARLGGEEFAILIESEDKEKILALVEFIRLKIEKNGAQHNTNIINFTISCGVACYTQDVDTIDKLMDMSDKALYDAKNEGRNQIKFRN